MSEIVLFHTAETNIEVFSKAAASAGFDRPLRHILRSDLLSDAEAAGSLTDDLRRRSMDAMAEQNAETLVCTCSTIGPGADDLAATGRSAMRVDRALAEAALKAGNRIAVLFAVETTEGPTRDLFQTVADEINPDAEILMVHVPGAWAKFRSGDSDGYFRAIADCIDGMDDMFDAVALAQASMAPAAELTQRAVLTSPGVVFAALL